MIHRIVVHQRGEVHQLDRAGQLDRVGLAATFDLAREQREGGSEQLAALAQEVRAHLLDHRQVVRHHVVHLGHDAIELGADRRLYGRQRYALALPPVGRSDRRDGAAHRVAFSSAFSRSATSWNWMSTTNTRW